MSSSKLAAIHWSRRVVTSYRDFNKTVNMTAKELEEWLKSSASGDSGWSKSDDSGETIGHER